MKSESESEILNISQMVFMFLRQLLPFCENFNFESAAAGKQQKCQMGLQGSDQNIKAVPDQLHRLTSKP